MSEKHTCPRRTENGMDREDGPFRGGGQNLDSYTSGHGMVGQPRGCTYCGSMPPDDFMEGVRSGAFQLGPTDKSYKVYVHEAVTEEQAAAQRQRMIGSYVGAGMSEAEAAQMVDSEGEFIGTGHHIGKFYFQHLSEPQMREFYDLLIAKRLNIGYPGRFYVLPFFMKAR